jgi:hypothetical protein
MLLLFTLSVLVGGGVAQVLIFPTILGVTARINKPLTWWRKVLPEDLRSALAGAWPWLLGTSAVLLLIALEVATFGVFPGFSDASQLLSILLGSLVAGYGLYIVSFIAGFARDIQREPMLSAA